MFLDAVWRSLLNVMIVIVEVVNHPYLELTTLIDNPGAPN